LEFKVVNKMKKNPKTKYVQQRVSDNPARFRGDGVKFILPNAAVSINRRLFGWPEEGGGETLRHAERNANPFCFLKNNNNKKNNLLEMPILLTSG